jgi:hypothetical protein
MENRKVRPLNSQDRPTVRHGPLAGAIKSNLRRGAVVVFIYREPAPSPGIAPIDKNNAIIGKGERALGVQTCLATVIALDTGRPTSEIGIVSTVGLAPENQRSV